VSAPELLRRIFLEVAAHIDGATLVERVLAAESRPLAPTHVLALGKVAGPMTEGLLRAPGTGALAGALLVAPAERLPPPDRLPAGFRLLASDHPLPGARSVQAGEAVRAFVAERRSPDRLLVLLSGGGSALAVLPAAGLSLEEKRAATSAVARAGASIGQLNTVRKHLSALKGGQLGICAQVPTRVLALSDVVGNDPATIASGPFSPDPTTFAGALTLLDDLAPGAAPAARAVLQRGAAGVLPETPKPGDPRLAGIEYQIIAGPELVSAQAQAAARASGFATGLLVEHTESPVDALALEYGRRAQKAVDADDPPVVLVGNGEPTIVVRGTGRGGRATHLALLVAREIAGLPGVAFLAAGTDDRDGSGPASGAVVDGQTWSRAVAQGLDPQAALAACDSATLLQALDCLVCGPGTSNLLDLHLLALSV
jgi:glycerate 2-kinase